MGRPILYKTSKEFLMRFGLSDLEELPSLKEFEALAREALGSDEGVASSEPSDGSVPDAPRASAAEAFGEPGTEPLSVESSKRAQKTDEQAHKTAAAGE